MENKKIIRLGDLCTKVKSGIKVSERINGSIPVRLIKSNNITRDNQIDFASIDKEMVRSSATGNVLHAGDILISLRYPEMIAIVPPEAKGYSFTTDFIALEIDSTIMDPQVVAAYLHLPHIAAYLTQKSQALPYVGSEMEKTILNLEMNVMSANMQENLAELMDLAIERKTRISTEAQLLTRLARSSVARYAGGIVS